MALKDYSDNEAVRSRGQDLVSTFYLPKFLFRHVLAFAVGYSKRNNYGRLFIHSSPLAFFAFCFAIRRRHRFCFVRHLLNLHQVR